VEFDNPSPPIPQEDLSSTYQPAGHVEWVSAKEEVRKDAKHAVELQQISLDASLRRKLDVATCAGLFVCAIGAAIGAVVHPPGSSWLAGLAGACLGFVGQKFLKSSSK
jgi:hypothetical protein